jgi:hypothetical protein
MSKMLAFGTLMIAALLFVPDQVQGQKRDANKGNVLPAGPQDYKTLERLKEVSGIIASADAKSIRFRIGNSKVVAAPGKKRGGVQVVQDYKEFELDLAEGVVIKKTFVAPEYDDKGNFKTNEAHAKELRTKGFIATKVEEIRSGNVAKLVLNPPKRGAKDEGVGNVPRPTVKAITLTQEGIPVEPAKGPEKKKKKA